MPEPASFADGLVGIVLDGRYRLDGVLGEGGMGAVFRAHHLAMDRKVAVKLLKPHLTQDEAALQRFAREARSTLKVDSPHAVKVLDYGVTPERDYYMVLEYLDGRTVQRELDVDGTFAPARVLHIAAQVAHALSAAHAKGLVHRDVKPDNLLLLAADGDPDFTKVLDFGVAKLMEGAARSSQSQLSLTQAGTVFGTPEFMSPEQACGQTLDGRSDLYSLGATMFAMLTGRGLFAASSAIEWLTAHVRTPPPHLADGLPELADLAELPALDALVQRCLAKRPADRPETAAQLAADLEALERRIAPAVARSAGPARTIAYPAALPATFSPSSFIPALQLAPASGEVRPMRRARRGIWLAIGAILVAGSVVAAIVVAATRGKRSSPQPPPPPLPLAVNAPPHDAAVVVPPVAPADAAPVAAVPHDAAPMHVAVRRPSKAAREVERFLAGAEAAKRTGNRLRWVSQADAALRLDPGNARAKLLLAEALVAYGDLEHGCKYLRELGHDPTALALARASCAGGD